MLKHKKYLCLIIVVSIISCSFIPAFADIAYTENRVQIDGQQYVEQTWVCKPLHPLSYNTGSYSMSQSFYAHPTGEQGLDLASKDTMFIYSSLPGTVIKAVRGSTGYGNHVAVRTSLGGIITLDLYYAHMLDGSIQVEEGDEIYEGELLGTMGSTGKSSGPHLHYEVRRDGQQIDPAKFLVDGITIQLVTPTF